MELLLGWLDGRNVQINTRIIDPADGLAQAQLIAKEFIAQRPNVILVQSTPHTAALQLPGRAASEARLGTSIVKVRV